MAYALTGSDITQTGTDTNLAGLAGVAGVTVISDGNHAVYNVGNLRIFIDGNQTIDPEVEELFVGLNVNNDGAVTVRNGGILTIGQEIISGAVSRFSTGTWARFTAANSSNFQETHSSLIVQSGGSLEWHGGTMFTRKNVSFMEGSTVNIYSQNAKIIGQHTGDFQLRQRSTLSNIQGLITAGLFVTFIEQPTAWNNWKPLNAPGQVYGFSGATPDNVFIVLRDLDSSSVDGQVGASWSDVWVRLINSSQGSATDIQGNSGNSDRNTGLQEFRQELTIIPQDTSRNLLTDAIARVRDTNNGLRLAANQIGTNPDYTADRTYQAGVVSGVISFDADGGILTGVYHRDTGGAQNSNNTYDYRGIVNDSTDVFIIYIAEYDHQITALTSPLKGNGGTQLDAFLVTDTNITNPKATVDAYPDFSVNTATDTITIGPGFPSDLDALYDRAKAWKIDNFNLEYPAIGGQLINASGGDLDLGALTLDISGSAPIGAGSKFAGIAARSTSTINLPQGNVDLTNVTFEAGATLNLDSGNALVTVNNNPGIATTGAGAITFQDPRFDITFTGYPTALVNGIATEPKIAVLNTNDGTWDVQLVTGGQITVTLANIGDGVGPFQIHHDAHGYWRTASTAFDLPATNLTVDVSNQFELIAELDGSNDPLVGQSLAADGLSVDGNTGQIILQSTNPSGVGYNFESFVTQYDLYTGSVAAQSTLDTNTVRSVSFLKLSSTGFKRIILPAGFTLVTANGETAAPVIQQTEITTVDGSDPVFRGNPEPDVIIENQGITPVTPQEIRDAMALAVSAGVTPTTGSIDSKLGPSIR